MAGQLGFYAYTSDNGSGFVVQMDKSNADAVSNTVAGAGGTKLPKDVIIPRYLTLERVNPVVGLAPLRRQIIVGDPTSAVWVSPPDTVALDVVGGAAVPFKVTGAVGERRTDLQQFN